jgi:glycosyltransferase involved in cell wall biosynthesis
MPAYNSVAYVEEALASAIDQDYPALQVVAGDDGSTDGTDEIIREYAGRYPDRVTAIVGEPHVGITANCNRMLQSCQGTYIAFHAGDDVFLPGKIRKQVQWFGESRQRVLCGHDVEVFDSATGRILFVQRPHIRAGHGASAFVRHGAFMYGQSIMIRADALPPGLYDERLPIASDVKLFIDILAAGDGEFGCIDGIYARYRRHAHNITNVGVLHVLDNLKGLDILERDYPAFAADCDYRRAHLEQAMGEWFMSQLQFGEARRYLKRAWRRSEPSVKAAGLLALAYLPVSVFSGLRHVKRSLLGGGR